MKYAFRKVSIFSCIFLLGLSSLWAKAGEVSEEIRVAHIIFQLAIILIGGKIGGEVASLVKLPRPLGQLVVGILISPYFLGSSFISLFNNSLFPFNSSSEGVPVAYEIYLLSTLSYVILLFMAGLETNIGLFLRYLFKGSVIGFFEVAFSFLATLFFASWYFNTTLFSPLALFIAVFISPTSVAIMAEVLFSRKKLGSPEGVIIITSAVLDDILSIVLLSVVMGLVALSGGGITESISVSSVILVIAKSLCILGAFGALALLSSQKLATLLKKLAPEDRTYMAIIALIIALIASVAMQLVGLSLIVGAYVTGLAFSNTDVKFVLREKLHILESFFVPIFFVVMGMFVDIKVLLDPNTLFLGVIFSLLATVVKVLGNAIPAYFMGFNNLGALRIGFGMVSRGEMTLVIASTALSLGFINSQIFAVAVAVTFLPSLIASPFISWFFGSHRSGTSASSEETKEKELVYAFPSNELAKIIIWEMQSELEEENYYVYHSKSFGNNILQVRKNSISFSVTRQENCITFSLNENDTLLVKTFLYEILLSMMEDLGRVKGIFNNYNQEISKTIEERSAISYKVLRSTLKYFSEDNIIFLNSHKKEEAIRELVSHLPVFLDQESVYQGVMAREGSYTTGFPGGLALPHARVEDIYKTEIIFGISPQGVDFGSMDGKKSHILALIISPKEGPSVHLEAMAQLTSLLNPTKSVFQEIIRKQTSQEVLSYLKSLKRTQSF